MTAQTDLINRSLQAIGTRSTIASISEGSNEANNAALCYDATRKELIRAAPWNFCTATKVLTLVKSAPGTPENQTSPTTWDAATQPPPGWSYEYAYPADCLRARKVVNNISSGTGVGIPLYPTGATSALPFWDLPGTRFQVTTDLVSTTPFTCILANIDQALLCYLRDITLETVWDPLFTDAFVQALAGRLALALTGDKALSRAMFQQANNSILEARGADANEGTTILDIPTDWIDQAHGYRWMPSQTGYCAPFGSLFSL